MKRLFKTMPFAIFAALAFSAVSHAGPRPNYPAAKQSSFMGIMALSYPGGFPAPSPGGAASLRNYPTAMPAARLDSGFTSTYPYPTNKWYTSLFANPLDNNTTDPNANFGNRFSPSPMTVIFDTRFPYAWNESPRNGNGCGLGYSIGGQDIAAANNNERYINNALAFAVQGAKASTISELDVIYASDVKLKAYSDWSVTTVLQDQTDSTKRMTATFGKGFAFVYNYFSPGVNPRLRMKLTGASDYVTYYYNNGGTLTQIPAGTNLTTTDRIMIRVHIIQNDAGNGIINVNSYQYFGIYAPAGTTFRINSNIAYCNIELSGTTENDRYLSIALLKSPEAAANDSAAFDIFNDYYQYAYNFVTNTQVSWSYDKSQSTLTTNFNFTFDAKRTGSPFISNQTVFALYPHQWKKLVGSPNKTNTYNSVRGLLKANAGSSFSTKYDFNGIVPFLTYEVPGGTATAKLQTYIDYDKTFDPSQARIDGGWKGNSNTYYHGKAVARAANLIQIFNQYGDFAARDLMINKLKTELSTWYSGQNNSKYFGYDTSWGGIIGSNPGGTAVNDFGASRFNDHHFHYGYFIYASAILAMHDTSFAGSSQYKGMVDLLVKEIANPYRNDASFPFLRNFDVYEGHSYANGRGGGDWWFGNDEESSSEAMNAWSGIYLWGLATGNQDWINLAVYGYTTQYEAAKNYYLNVDGDIWPRSTFNHASTGMLFDGASKWSLWWTPVITQTVMGIQVMPLTQSLLYMGYDAAYAQNFYNEMWNGRDPSNNNLWKDVWLRYEAVFNAPQALADWDSANLAVNFPDTFNQSNGGDDGSSMSYSYQFIHFFNAMGAVDTNYYANDPAFLVMNKNGTRTFIACNPTAVSKTVNFYRKASSAAPAVPGSAVMTIPPRTTAQTKDFMSFKYAAAVTSYSAVASSNTARAVYSIYSDNFLGAVVGGNAYNDSLTQDSWEQTIDFTPHVSTSAAYEGANYLSASRNSQGWGGWGFKFAAGATDMSSFYGGRIEVTVKLDSPSPAAANFEIGFETIFGQSWFTLSSLGFKPSSTSWQTISIPLSGQSVTAQALNYVTIPFMMRHNSGASQSEWGVPVNIDSVLWKKANIATNFSVALKNRSGGLAADKITWGNSDFRRANALAQQYAEITLDSVDGNGWGIQIYTDNTSSDTVSDVPFAGNITSSTVSGLINSSSPAADMLPMKWRCAPSTISDSDVFVPNDQSTWGYCRDRHAFNSSGGLYSGCGQIKLMNRAGYRWSETDYRALPDDKKIRIYFIADFTNALNAVSYKSNIVLEYFNE